MHITLVSPPTVRGGIPSRSWKSPRGAVEPNDASPSELTTRRPSRAVSRIRWYDATEESEQRARCRELGRYHEARARRAIDRAQWTEAERHARQALVWDDTRAANYVALADALRGHTPPDYAGARATLQTAMDLEPANPYVVAGLVNVCESVGDIHSAVAVLRHTLAAGAPARLWARDLARLTVPLSELFARDRS